MKHDSFKTYLHWGLTAFGVVALSILFFFSLFKVGALVHFFQTLLGILMPFVYGLAMAYLLTPVFNWLHARFAPTLQKHVKNPRRAARAAKFLSTTLSVLLALLLVAALLWMVLPQVISSIVGLVESNLLTNSIQNVTGWIEDTLQNNPQFEAAAQRVYAAAVAALTAWVKTDMLPQLTNLMSGLLGTLTFFKNVFIGIIIAIYVLNSKQLFAAQAKKLLYGCLSTRRANIVLDNARFTHRVFGGFINGKLLDSLIIGILCFVGMTALRMPYAMLISVVVGVTNIIPFFGPFIGAIPSGLLILLIDPLKALYFVLFILALQQFCWPAGCSGLSAWSSACRCLRCCTASSPGWCAIRCAAGACRRKHRPIMNWTMWMSAHTTSYTMRLRPGRPRDLRTGLNDRLSALN